MLPLDQPPAASGPAGAIPWSVGGDGLSFGAAAAQPFMRRASETELREAWVHGRRDARAAFKKRAADSTRQQRLRARGAGGRAPGGRREE